MKKLSTAIITSVLVIALVGCVKSDREEAASENSLATDKETDVSTKTDNLGASSDDSADMEGINKDACFTYNGKEISVLSDVPNTLEKLGTPNADQSVKSADVAVYGYGDGDLTYNTCMVDGVESPLMISIGSYSKVKTSRNVGIGDSRNDVVAAYGTPNDTVEGFTADSQDLASGEADISNGDTLSGQFIKYEFDGCVLTFEMEDDHVASLTYINKNVEAKIA
ncbi:MAG: hypothetical protein J5802_05630 [Butyrivibrio sp.]|nr:hypothetical protein [Butyrivibrio sp.]